MPLGMRGLFATWASPDRCPVSAHVSYMVRFVKPNGSATGGFYPAAGDFCAARTHTATLSLEADIQLVAALSFPLLPLPIAIGLPRLLHLDPRRLLTPG